ncbi:hypothetical protein ATANTOWER_026868 [Ataeniobius toweri]|uniref:Uncharacterized protein n=1 Tax=Ataeniobius toweri TaxID=208326 RepID=A0ABU7CLW1_9TELE|nr:hypothetical protein [Ataeniobius toweri]
MCLTSCHYGAGVSSQLELIKVNQEEHIGEWIPRGRCHIVLVRQVAIRPPCEYIAFHVTSFVLSSNSSFPLGFQSSASLFPKLIGELTSGFPLQISSLVPQSIIHHSPACPLSNAPPSSPSFSGKETQGSSSTRTVHKGLPTSVSVGVLNISLDTSPPRQPAILESFSDPGRNIN